MACFIFLKLRDSQADTGFGQGANKTSLQNFRQPVQ